MIDHILDHLDLIDAGGVDLDRAGYGAGAFYLFGYIVGDARFKDAEILLQRPIVLVDYSVGVFVPYG